MKPSIKTTLELFVEKAEELIQEEFTLFLEEFGHHLRYEYLAQSQQMLVSTIAPSHTMQKSFILTYRMFVQGSEHMRLVDPTKPISIDLLDPSLSSQWLEQVQDVTRNIHTFLREQSTVPLVIHLIDQQGNKKTEMPSRWDILETLLYGEYAHSSQHERLKNWLSTPFEPMVRQFLMVEFRNILVYTLRGIQHLAQYARIELGVLQNE